MGCTYNSHIVMIQLACHLSVPITLDSTLSDYSLVLYFKTGKVKKKKKNYYQDLMNMRHLILRNNSKAECEIIFDEQLRTGVDSLN